MRIRNKITKWFTFIYIVFNILNPLHTHTVYAMEIENFQTYENGNSYITNSHLEKNSKEVVNGDTLNLYDQLKYNVDFSIDHNKFKQGDILVFDIPKELDITDNFKFTLGTPDGRSEVGKMEVKKDLSGKYKAYLTFTTDYIETHSSFKGSFVLMCTLNSRYVSGGSNIIPLPDGSININVDVPVRPSSSSESSSTPPSSSSSSSSEDKSDGDLSKIAYQEKSKDGTKYIRWIVDFGENTLMEKLGIHSLDELDSLYIEDTPKEQTFIDHSTVDNKIPQGTYLSMNIRDKYNKSWEKHLNEQQAGIAADKRSMKVNILPTLLEEKNDRNEDGKKPVSLIYTTKPDDPSKTTNYTNHVKIIAHLKKDPNNPKEESKDGIVSWDGKDDSHGNKEIVKTGRQVKASDSNQYINWNISFGYKKLFEKLNIHSLDELSSLTISDSPENQTFKTLFNGSWGGLQVSRNANPGRDWNKDLSFNEMGISADKRTMSMDLLPHLLGEMKESGNDSGKEANLSYATIPDNPKESRKVNNKVKITAHFKNNSKPTDIDIEGSTPWEGFTPPGDREEIPTKSGTQKENRNHDRYLQWQVKMHIPSIKKLAGIEKLSDLKALYFEDTPEKQKFIPFDITFPSGYIPKDTYLRMDTPNNSSIKVTYLNDKDAGVSQDKKILKTDLLPHLLKVMSGSEEQLDKNTFLYYTTTPDVSWINQVVKNNAKITAYTKANPDRPVSWELKEQTRWDNGCGNIYGSTAGIKISKVDAETKKALAGAQFDIYNSDNKKIGSLTTDQNGQAQYPQKSTDVTDGLIIGDYYLKETKAPSGYQINSNNTYNFSITKDDLKQSTFENMYYKQKTIENQRQDEKIDINGTKTWEDNNDQDGKRPEKIVIHLLKNGKEIDSKEVTKAQNWQYSFKNLPKNENGKENNYAITENVVPGYEAIPNGYNLTNKHTPKTTEVSGTKTWEDNNNQDRKRPEKITVHLMNGNKEVATKEVSEKDGWKYSFTGLPVYENGKKIEYTLKEDQVPGYTTKVDGYNLTNKYTPETTEVSGAKTWDDNNDQDGKRPEKIVIHLLKNGKEIDSKEVTKAQNWQYSFKNLPKKENGKENNYAITENVVPGYEAIPNGYNLTNKHTPEKTEISGTKTWEDNNNQDRKRPEKITVHLMNGNKEVATKEVSEKDGWKYSFTGLPVYENGKKIEYTLKEDQVPGYTTKVDGYNLTNKYTPTTIEISGKKTWDDNNNQDGKRPEKIMVYLVKNNRETVSVQGVTKEQNWEYSFKNLPKEENGKEINYTITEQLVNGYERIIDGYNLTNKHTPEKTEISGTKTWEDNNNQDRKRPEKITVHLMNGNKEVATKEVSEKDGWKYSFTGLPVYENGKKIEYTLKEDQVPGYTTKVDGYNLTNKYTPTTIEISGKKTWDDNNNQDGKRPEKIMVYLVKNNRETVSVQGVTKEQNWEYSFKNLPKEENGKEINYTITEQLVNGYERIIDGYNLTNKHTPEKTEISGTKTWEDNNNQDRKRPEKITVHLMNGNKEVATKEVSEKDGWKYSFTGLPVYENGRKIEYTLKEDQVPGYTTKVDGYNLTNKYTPTTIEISGKKTWDDNNNQDGKRPEKIMVYLVKNNRETVSVQGVTKEQNWEYSFKNLPKEENGKEINYTITEQLVNGYERIIDGYNLTNKHTPEKTEISGTKTWEDNNNQDRKRPEKITVHLMNGNKEVATKEVSEKDGWKYSFTGLPVYEKGQKIHYTVKEDKVAGYTTLTKGSNLVNTHVPEVTEVSGTKTWEDNNNQDGKRPEKITVRLMNGDKEVATKEVSEKEGWKYSFTGLPVYEKGQKIHYTVKEDKVAGYTTLTKGSNLVNT
ncbi:Cna B-type domain-containing protein, partial [Melissococcus plutonius]|uniref:Cna B-type domain-containing protein n=1 Tax=Melissococcus plutonius TaxID=33970 RepID=UPI003C2C6417